MCACALCFCMRLRLRLPLAIAAAHVRQGTRPMLILTARCQMAGRRSLMQEGSFLGREIAYCGIQRQTWVASKTV